nr:hypothetical protein [Tanacetum cinerariifolium]
TGCLVHHGSRRAGACASALPADHAQTQPGIDAPGGYSGQRAGLRRAPGLVCAGAARGSGVGLVRRVGALLCPLCGAGAGFSGAAAGR